MGQGLWTEESHSRLELKLGGELQAYCGTGKGIYTKGTILWIRCLAAHKIPFLRRFHLQPLKSHQERMYSIPENPKVENLGLIGHL